MRRSHGHVSALRRSPSLTTATRAGGYLDQTALRATTDKCDRVLAGYIPGRGADGAEHVPAQRRGHVHVPAWARDLERVRVDVVIPVCAGRDVCESRRGSGFGVYTVCWVSLGGTYDTAEKGEQWNEWSDRPLVLLIETKRHLT